LNWQTFYLALFLAGFVLATFSLAAGFLHLPIGHGFHLPHAQPHAHASGGLSGSHGAGGPSAAHLSPFNFASAMAFLAWMGGVGLLLTGRASLSPLVVLALSAAGGWIGGLLVFAFMSRVLLRREAALDRADFEMVGVLGRVIVPIRGGGTGEISYSQAGTRRIAGARRDGDGPVPRDSEVVVTRYEKGIAYVRPWDEL
jgi:membrane protein implicated in regulation of membrane protease activity